MELMFGRKVRLAINLLKNFRSNLLNITTVEQFKSRLQDLYELAQNKMKSRKKEQSHIMIRKYHTIVYVLMIRYVYFYLKKKNVQNSLVTDMDHLQLYMLITQFTIWK